MAAIGILGALYIVVALLEIFVISGNYKVGMWQGVTDRKAASCKEHRQIYTGCSQQLLSGSANVTPKAAFWLPPAELDIAQYDPQVSVAERAVGLGTLWWINRLTVHWKYKEVHFNPNSSLDVDRIDPASLHVASWIPLRIEIAYDNCTCYFDQAR